MTEGTSAPVNSTASAGTPSSKQGSSAAAGKKKSAASSSKSKAHTASHPKYAEMIKAALQTLNDRGGSSRAAILKYVLANYKITEPTTANQHLKVALKNGVASQLFKQTKGTGASGSFKLGTATGSGGKKKKSSASATKKSASGSSVAKKNS